MIPKKNDIEVWRGTTFELELMAQRKVYNYDPAVNNTKTDLQRSHEENQEFYGFEYEYVDFDTEYDSAKLVVLNPWLKAGKPSGTPLAEITSEDGDIVLSDMTVKVTISSDDTRELDFDDGSFELLLIKDEVLSAEDTGAGVNPEDLVHSIIYGEFIVKGTK